MVNINDIYYDLTQVNIDEQRIIWDERGRGYYGEYLVLQKLYLTLEGTSKILMNLQIPTRSGKTTEIDLLLIHESGLYVFEIKHYKSVIYGSTYDKTWTQYFRTASNQKFQNPVFQNQYHINALRNRYPGIPVYSVIVFTNPECDLRVNVDLPDTIVCTLSQLPYRLHGVLRHPAVFDTDKIDHLFDELKEFSPISSKTVTVGNNEAPLYQYINTFISEHQAKLKNLEKDYSEKLKKIESSLATSKKQFIILSSLLGVACIIICLCIGIYSRQQIALAETELSSFAQKIKPVSEYNNGEITFSDSLVLVSDVLIEDSSDIKDTVNFSCTLTGNGDKYGIRLAKNTKYIVMLKDGTIQEYDLFGSDFRYSSLYRISRGHFDSFALPCCEFYNVSSSDISYVKLVNLSIWKNPHYNDDLFFDYEVELYRNN